MGRILRTGTDTITNYNVQETSAYDEDNPAATRSAWADLTITDQSFTQLPFSTVPAEGAVVTFTRLPDTFLGAMVKIRPTYDSSAGEVPAFEMWTFDGTTWTRRRRIELANVFVGVPSGTSKVLDLTFFPFLRGVQEVWLTMDPGSVGAPTMEFISIQLFGQCETSLRNDRGNGGGDPCSDPTDPFYTGFDDDGNPCPGTTFGPPGIDVPTLDVCNPTSVARYRDFAATIPGFLEVFDAWLETNAQVISQYCAGITGGPAPSPPSPPGSPPALPPLDLCDEASIEAFRAALSADAVADFDAYLDGLETVGFFDLACQEEEPPEVYVDPETLAQADEPDSDGNTPFGSGPGGQPQFPRPDDRPNAKGVTPSNNGDLDQEFHVLFLPGTFAKDFFLANLAGQPQEMQDAVAESKMRYVFFGADSAPVTNVSTAFARLNSLSFNFRNLIPGNVVGIRTAIGSPASPTQSVFVDIAPPAIDSSGYAPIGTQNARFELASADFGLEDVISIAGHKTFLRRSGSSANDTLSFNATADNGLSGNGDAFFDNFLLSTVENIGSVMTPVYQAGQSSVALYGVYFHVIVRRKEFQFAVTMSPGTDADTADHRAALLPGTTCTTFGCTIG